MYDIFISYKRKSLATANNLYYRLITKGYTTFFDLEEMRRDNFNTQLLTYIENANDVFVVLEEGSLDACLLEKNPRDTIVLEDGTRERKNWKDDWFCREIAYALERKKNIIPVLIGDCTMPKADSLPSALKELSLKHSPEFSFSYFDDYINKLIEKGFITSLPQRTEDRAASIFKFYSNKDCMVYKEGKLVCSLEADSEKPYYLPVEHKGDYSFKIEDPKTKQTQTIREHIDAAEEKEVYVKWKPKTNIPGIAIGIGILAVAFFAILFLAPIITGQPSLPEKPDTQIVENSQTDNINEEKDTENRELAGETAETLEKSDTESKSEVSQNSYLLLGDKPSAADLEAIHSEILFPEERDYLDEYSYATVEAPGGHSVYSFGSAAHDGTPQTLLNGEKVLILAEHKGYSCVIVLSQQKARWVNSDYLVKME